MRGPEVASSSDLLQLSSLPPNSTTPKHSPLLLPLSQATTLCPPLGKHVLNRGFYQDPPLLKNLPESLLPTHQAHTPDFPAHSPLGLTLFFSDLSFLLPS